MNIAQIIALAAAGKEIDFTKLDYAAIGLDEATVKKIVADTKAQNLMGVLEIPDAVVKAKAEPLIQAAAAEEKKKLYDTVESIKKQNQTLLQQIEAEKAAKEAALKEEAEKQALAERGKLDAKGAIAELESRFTKALTDRETELLQKLRETESRATGEILKLHREKIIAASNGQIIEELLVGNTPEELAASAELARQKYATIHKEVEDRLKREQDAAAQKTAQQRAEEEQKKKSLSFVRSGEESARTAIGTGVVVDPAAIKAAQAGELSKIKDDVLKQYGF